MGFIPFTKMRCCLAALLAAMLLPATSRAALIYDFVTDNNNSNYTVLPNGTAVVSVFLRETLTSGSTSQLVPQDGLISAVVQLTRTTSPTAPATITSANRDASNFNFSNDSTVISGGAQANAGGIRNAANGTPIITDSSTVRRVSVGNFTIQGGLIPLQTTTFTLSDRASTANDTTTFVSATVLDSQITSRTFTVTILPEPATLGVVGLGALALLARRRRAARL